MDLINVVIVDEEFIAYVPHEKGLDKYQQNILI